TSIKLHYHYDSLDNTQHAWWFKKANDHQRKIATYDPMILDQYQAYYLGENKKIIYLTFDEGGNDKTYIKEITDILNRHDVKASFFLTRNYILQESEFMNELVEKGHEIGNHTRNHYDMTKLANSNDCERFVKEIMETHLSIYQITKSLPPLIFRFPKGEFSKRSLAMVHDLGFRTYFWSHAYNDYSEDVVKEVSYNNLVSHLHQGAIYLLHPSNRGNYEAMEEFILEVKSQGYTFGLVSQIKKD
ncbi:MAG: polysaccharide deacetylase family protein, partial [Traorella sp.]